MTARVGAVHLGWDVVSVAAGGGGTPIRPVQVEGTHTPPAYLLADSSGRLHTAGVDRRPDLGIAISDVRDVLGHHQIRIAGATWPVELVYRARMYNPLAAVGKYLRGKPDVVALPFPDDWPDEKIDEYCRLVELLDVTTEPLPESVALSGYVRALGLVRPPERGRAEVGATGVYSDGRVCLVVAVHGDDERPTESVGVPIAPDAMRDARSADNVVIEVMAAARSINADTSTVLLTGNVCFNDALRLAFQNHLGHRLRVADHPMHALVLGAARSGRTAGRRRTTRLATRAAGGRGAAGGPPASGGPGGQSGGSPSSGGPAGSGGAAMSGGEGAQSSGRHGLRPLDQGPRHVASAAGGQADSPPGSGGRHAARETAVADAGAEPTTRMTRSEVPGSLPPGLAELGSRFTRPPGAPAGDEPTTAFGPHPEADEDSARRGKLWNKVKDNLFGAPAIAGAVALAAVALHPHGDVRQAAVPRAHTVASVLPASVDAVVRAEPPAASVVPAYGAGTEFGAWPSVEKVSRVPHTEPPCSLIPHALGSSARPPEAVSDESGCAHLGIDNLRYVIPTLPGVTDQDPPMRI
ncbi:hypothetical protein [Nocardia terpenica]|uniref:hypothetical protein n=1 Tax=Nocardia terpenica TaxID=455432 RepID=UPI0039E0A63F